MVGPGLQRTTLEAIEDPERRNRVRQVASDSATALTRYMAGNLIISLIAGVATYIALAIMGVPFKEVLALWVAFADLIPLVGATLGAVPAVLVAFLHSTTAGIAVLVFFILYQQFENHVLQVTVMSRSVSLNPLAVLVSVLVGVELFGILGALLAIPVAGVLQVIAVDFVADAQGPPRRRHRVAFAPWRRKSGRRVSRTRRSLRVRPAGREQLAGTAWSWSTRRTCQVIRTSRSRWPPALRRP